MSETVLGLRRDCRVILALAGLALAMLLPAAARAQTGNPAHDQLAALDEPARRAELSRTLSGAGCQTVIGSYFAGFDDDRAAYWDSRCRQGGMFRLTLLAQRFARPAVTACGATTGGIAAGPCFQPVGTAAVATVASSGGTGVAAGPSAAPPPGSRFGAVYATDAPVAAWGFANGVTDRLAVNTNAVRACQTMAGRIPCKFIGELVNRCGALAQAITRNPNAVTMTNDLSTIVLNRNYTATGDTPQAAEAAALEACRRTPAVICRVVATGC
jgi:hypothetical protein